MREKTEGGWIDSKPPIKITDQKWDSFWGKERPEFMTPARYFHAYVAGNFALFGEGESVELVIGPHSEWRKLGEELVLVVGESVARIKAREKQKAVRVSSEMLSSANWETWYHDLSPHSAEPLSTTTWYLCIRPLNGQTPCPLCNKAVDTHKHLGAREWGVTVEREIGHIHYFEHVEKLSAIQTHHFTLTQIVNHFSLVSFFSFLLFFKEGWPRTENLLAQDPSTLKSRALR